MMNWIKSHLDKPTITPAEGVFLVAGLGNPGIEYKKNRHNVGFMTLDSLAAELKVQFNRIESKALLAKTSFQDYRLLLAKPQTYMNLSGQPVSSLARYYRLPAENILIVYDDIDLPFGTIRFRTEGGSGGHKGMQSIIDKMGHNRIARLRIGINRPSGNRLAASYVLQDFSNQEMEQLSFGLKKYVESILCFITEGSEKAMNLYNNVPID